MNPLFPIPHARRAAFSFGLACMASLPTFAVDTATSTWTGGTTVWATSGNWGSGTPSTTLSAKFNGTFGNQPQLGATSNSQGLWLATGVTQDVTITGLTSGKVLNLAGTATLSGQTNAGIILDDTADHNLTLGALTTTTLTNSTGFYVNNKGTLTVAGSTGTLGLGANTLTLGGATPQGVISIPGLIGGAGGSIVINTAGTVNLGTAGGGNSSFSGGVTLTAGTLNLNKAGALGTVAGTFAINGGTINNTSGASLIAVATPVSIGGDFAAFASGSTSTNNLSLNAGAITNAGDRTITLNGTGTSLTMGGLMTNSSGGVQTTTVNGAGNTFSLGSYALSDSATDYVNILKGTGNINLTGIVSNGGTSNVSGLIYSGSGTLTLGGANTFGGGLTLNSGTLNIGATKSLGGATSTFTLNGGTIDASAVVGAQANNNAITLGGNFTFGGTNSLNLGTGAIANSGDRTITLNGTSKVLTLGGTMTNTGTGVQTTTVNGASSTLTLGGYALSNGAANVVDVINGSAGVTISGTVANGGTSTASGLSYAGTGKLILNGTNTFTGGLNVQSGTVQVGNATSVGAGLVTVGSTGNSATLDLNGQTETFAGLTTAGTAANQTIGNSSTSSNAQVNYSGPAATVFGGVIRDTLGSGNKTTGLAMNSTSGGNLILTGANLYTGATVVQQGTLTLDFSAAGAPASNIINSGNALTFGNSPSAAGSDTLAVIGKAGTANTQTLGAITLNTGASHLNLTAGSGGSVTVALGALGSHGFGQTLDISLGANTVVTTTSTNTSVNGGTLPAPLITINGTDFATINGSSQIVALTSYTANTATTLNTSAGQVVDMTTANTTLASNTPGAMGDLRFNNAADTTITLNPGVVAVVGGANGASGQILVTANMGNHKATITGGVLQGISSRDLVVVQNNTAGDFQIDSVITDFSTNTDALTKSGAGKLIVTATNAYQGVNYVNEGTLMVTGNYVPLSSQTLTTTASTTITGVNTTGLFIGERISGTNIPSSSYITGISGTTITLSQVAAAGTGNIDFKGGSGLGINSTGTAVQIGAGATLQLGNGGGTGGLEAGAGVVNNGTFIFNGSGETTFAHAISGTGALTKQASDTVTLAGTNTYTGATKIKGGTLKLASATSNNPIGGSSAIIVGDSLANNSAVLDVTGVTASGGFKVQSGQTIAGHGTVLGDATFLSGSSLSPGNSAGTTTYNGNLILGAGTSLVFDLAATGASDKVVVTGSGHLLILNSQSINDFTFNLLGGFGAGTYTLIDSSANGITGALNPNPANLTEVLGGYNATLSLSSGNVILTVAAVPEPGTWALMLGGLGLLAGIQRRRAKRA